MGVTAGWDEIMDGTTLRGIAADDPHLSSSDGDWLLNIRPAQGYQYLLTNPDGFTNHNGLVECEVEPPDKLPGGKNAEEDKVVKQFMGPLKGRRVRVVGTWVRDRQHTYEGNDVALDYGLPGDWGKTEIHPVASLLGKLPPPDSSTRRFVFLVFADDSGGMPPTPAHPFSDILPPHVGESRNGDFRLAVPAGTTITKVQENDQMAGSSLSVASVTMRGVSYVEGKVTSGKPNDGKGFYHLVFDIPALFSLRALLQSPWDVVLPSPCQHLARELKALKDGTARKFDKDLKEWVDLPSTPGAIAAKQKQLDECLKNEKTKTLGLREWMARSLPSPSFPCQHLAAELKAFKNGTAKKFDPQLRTWVDVPSTPAAIAVKQKELDACLAKAHDNADTSVSVRTLIEDSYP